jgi:hypothetical protein
MNIYKDKHIFIPIFLAFAAIVGYRAWLDMHPPAHPPRAIFDTYYFVHDDKGMAPFTADPDDERALVVFAGHIHGGKDGLALDPSPVTPISLPQREIILMFTLDAVPDSLDDLAPLLTKQAERWRYLGDIINDLYIKGPLDKKSFGELLAGVNSLREALHDEYWLGLYAARDPLLTTPDVAKKTEEAGKSLRTVILNAAEAQKPSEKLADTILKLDHDNEVPFLLEVDQLPDFNALQKALKPEPERFVGFMLDAEKAAPPAK